MFKLWIINFCKCIVRYCFAIYSSLPVSKKIKKFYDVMNKTIFMITPVFLVVFSYSNCK